MAKARLDVNVSRVKYESIVDEAESKAAALRIMKKAGADAYGYQASAEAKEMQEKGYTYQQETQRKTTMAAMENAGSSPVSSGVAADMVQIGVGLNMAKQVAEMANTAMQPAAPSAVPEMPAEPAKDTWTCSCGQSGNTKTFCPNCGAKKPSSVGTWDCACGQKGNTRNFCPSCGARKPSLTWDCSCGQTGNKSPFCPSCGKKRP